MRNRLRISKETSRLADIFTSTYKKIIRSRFEVSAKSELHQADLFLPHDTVWYKTYKYALTLVDVGTRYKEQKHGHPKTVKKLLRHLREYTADI